MRKWTLFGACVVAAVLLGHNAADARTKTGIYRAPVGHYTKGTRSYRRKNGTYVKGHPAGYVRPRKPKDPFKVKHPRKKRY